ncbi:MAG: DoxX family protein [Bacteroidetes bacterium]|nr:DoxX family protein [Bacteroidota bacterium]
MTNKYSQWSPLLLRLAVGFGAMAHGWAKLSRGPAGFEKLLTQIGIPFPHFTSWVVTIAELTCGFAILVGAFELVAALVLIVTMLVAMFTVQIHYGFSSVNTIGLTPEGPLFGPPGYEINLLYIASLVSIILTGPGTLSMGSLLRRLFNRTRAADTL